MQRCSTRFKFSAFLATPATRRRAISRSGTTLLLLTFGLAPAAQAQSSYRHVSVPPLPGHLGAFATSVSDPVGPGVTVAVTSFPAGGHAFRQAYLWRDSDNDRQVDPEEQTPLGALVPGGWSEVIKISPSGTRVVGFTQGAPNPRTNNTERAFLWTEETGMKDLNDYVDPTLWHLWTAIDVNDQGQIVGRGTYFDGTRWKARAFLLDLTTGAIRPLESSPTAGYSSQPCLNALGQALFQEYNENVNDQTSVDVGGVVTKLGVAYGEAISDDSRTVGMHFFGGSRAHAYYAPSLTAAPVDLGTLGGYASKAVGVNAQGTVVGESEVSKGNQDLKRAFRWQASVGGKMTDLNRFLPRGSKVELRRAYGINGAGWIVGYAHDGATGMGQGFVLIP